MVFFLSKSIKLAFELHQQTKAVRTEEEEFIPHHHQITRITDLLLYLRERYEKEEDLRRPYHLFFARKQKGGERLRDYFHGLQILQNEVQRNDLGQQISPEQLRMQLLENCLPSIKSEFSMRQAGQRDLTIDQMLEIGDVMYRAWKKRQDSTSRPGNKATRRTNMNQLSVQKDIKPNKKLSEAELAAFCKRMKQKYGVAHGKFIDGDERVILQKNKLCFICFKASCTTPDALENIIKQLLAEGKLERGASPYQSPAFIVTKANGSPRLVVDYRRANELTVPEAYPLRRVEDIIADQHGMKYWSQVDLADAFWQLHLDEASRDILAIVTKSGSYRWIALPQGWHSSPIHFQAFVDSLFANVKGVHTYQDDLILSTTTRAGMVKLVKEVFHILSENSLYVKQEKVKLMQTSCNILGFNISFNRVMPTETLVKKIVDYPCPRNMTELKGFLGLVLFYHDLIPEYTESLLPLSRLAQEKVPWRWTQHQEEAFHRVKALIQSPELQVCLPDPRKPFIMYVDSSTYAYGAALFQRDGDKILPVSYFSGGYKPAERNYDIGSLELLALRKACAHWKVLLEHNQCDIYTDNSPLSYLLNKDLNQCTKKERKTINELSTYRLKIHHLKGAKNQLADYLSRRSVTVLDMCSGTGGAATVLSALPLSKQMVKKVLRQENLVSVITLLHNSTHAGQRRTLDLIKTWFDVSKVVDLEETVKRICSECPTCQLCNSHGERSRQYKPVIARAPYDYVCIDFTKVGKTASTGEDTIVTFTEKWSRYVVTVAIKAAETTSADMARIFMRNVYPFFGCPVHIVSDQDVRFTAKYWQNFMKHIGTKLNFTTSYAPWSDGQSELTNRVILNGLKKTLKDYNQWPDLLQVVTEIHNSLPNTVTGVSPSEALFRLPPVPISVRKLLSKEDNSSVYLPSDAQAKEYARKLKGMLEHVRAKNEAVARKLQKKRDTRKPIAIGNLVKFILIRDATQRTLGERKTHFIWRGPGKCQEEGERKRGTFTSVAAVNKGLSKSNDTYTIDSYKVVLATFENLISLLEEARAKGKGNARAKEELVTLCARLEAKNEKLFRRLLPELWQKIVDEYLDQNDELAFAMTCRFFRERQKDLGWELMTILEDDSLLEELLEDQESGNVTPHTLGWFQWVCDNWEIQPGFKWRSEKVKGAVYECDLLNYAAFQGSIEILRWLMEEKGWELNRETGRWAGLGGSVEVFEYLNGKGYEFDRNACSGAAWGGHLKALKYLRGLVPPCLWDEGTCAKAAQGGHLDVLKWARAQDPPCPWVDFTCSFAAEGGHLDVLKWARAQDPPCPWSEITCAYVASGGHLEVLKWLRAQEPPCPWSEDTCVNAAEAGHLDVLKFLRSQDPPCPWSEDTCANAAEAGHLEVLKFLRSQDPPCPWSWTTCSQAARMGHLGVLKWARAQDPPCPWSEITCAYVAKGGHLEVLKWLRAQEPPCPWSEDTCANAAYGGRLEVLKWARAQDPPCPWSWTTCSEAAEGGHLEVLKWARDHDPPCPWLRSWCRDRASAYGHQHIIDWIDQQEDEIVSNTF
ncbi:retrovirus-related Pol polyprotein [Chloropicon roscoffensis]|uniref:Retrovirus-related Pol polyprotein n=1 Tax=Chloropicon roscoffensis TaxID=1461544 RepID=A0AAX4PDL6_9CHLO